MTRNIQKNRGGEVWSWIMHVMKSNIIIFYQDTGVFAVIRTMPFLIEIRGNANDE